MRTCKDTALGWLVAITLAALTALPAFAAHSADDAPHTVRVTVLQFGTTSWELDVIRHHGLDREAGIRLDVREVSSNDAASVAMQSRSTDVIINDWIWVSRQRSAGRPWTFFPWSTAVGSVLVDPDAGINSLQDLEGRRIGVAGGSVDKSWLLLQALYQARYDRKLTSNTRASFGAPPLLNRLMLRGDLDAVINYWHFGARLEAAGMQTLIGIPDMLSELGIDQTVPLLGWIFSETWAEQNPEAIAGLLQASYAAKRIMAESDAEWERLAELTKAEDTATLQALRESFRQGIPGAFGDDEIRAAGLVYQVLAREGGQDLTGGHKALAPGTFWQPGEVGFSPWQP